MYLSVGDNSDIINFSGIHFNPDRPNLYNMIQVHINKLEALELKVSVGYLPW